MYNFLVQIFLVLDRLNYLVLIFLENKLDTYVGEINKANS